MRTIRPEDFASYEERVLILDVRREDDFEASDETLKGAVWKNPSSIDEWISDIPKNEKVILYCARGGGISNSVVDRLLAEGIDASYLEGGIEAAKNAGIAMKKTSK